MKSRVLIIIGITIVSAISLSYYAIYDSSTTVFIDCDPRYTQIDGKCVLRNLEQKIEKVVTDAEGDPNKIGQNYVRLAIDSDIFSHDEKLKVLEKYVKEKNISTPFTENVITGKQEFKTDELITFTWKQFGIGHPCTNVSIQVQSKSSDKMFYEYESQRLCQVLDEDVPFLQTWTRDDFPDFPYCSELGEYVIKVKTMFGEFGAYHEYSCKGPLVGDDVINTEPERPSGKPSMPPVLISTNGTGHVTIWPNSTLSVEVMCPTDNPYPNNYQILFDKVPYDTKVQGVQHVSEVRDGIEFNGFVFDFKNPTNESESTTIQVNCSVTPEPRTEPEPEPTSVSHQNLIDASNKLREIYDIDSSLGPFNIKDVIVGHGMGDGFLIVDILKEYYDSAEDRELIIQKIVDITGGNVDIEFNSSGAIAPTNIEFVFPYVWNSFLNRNGIEFTPKEQSYANTDIGYERQNRVCSPIVTSNGTEFYISSIFTYEPFEITGTFIDKIKPDDCYKVWKTDTVLVEPDRILMLWLENYHKENEN